MKIGSKVDKNLIDRFDWIVGTFEGLKCMVRQGEFDNFLKEQIEISIEEIDEKINQIMMGE